MSPKHPKLELMPTIDLAEPSCISQEIRALAFSCADFSISESQNQAYAKLARAKVTRMKSTRADLRRENLRRLIDEKCGGSQTQVKERTGISLSQLGQWLSGDRNMGETSARKVESRMGLPDGWMDSDEAQAGSNPPASASRAVKMLRLVKGMSADDLAAAANVAADTILQVERGVRGEPEVLAALATAFGISLEDLLRQETATLDGAQQILTRAARNANDPSAPLLIGDEHGAHEAQPTYVGRYSADRAIGVVGIAQLGENGYYEQLDYPVGHGDGYVMHGSKDPDAYVLQVRGDSMKPAIRNGWYVLVEPNGTPTPGEYVLIQLNDGRKMTKELLFKQRNGDIEVMSVNGDVRLSLHSTQIEQIHPVAAVIPPSQIRYL